MFELKVGLANRQMTQERKAMLGLSSRGELLTLIGDVVKQWKEHFEEL